MTENKTYKQKDVDRIIRTVSNIKQQFIESIDCQIEKLQNLQPAEPERKEWRHELERGEKYLHIEANGDIVRSTWSGYYIDKRRYYAGNCFPCESFTEEQVQQIAWQNQLNSLLAQYAIANGVLASKEEMEDNEKRLQWVSSSDCIGRSYKHYPAVALFNDEDVAIAAFCDVVKPFLTEHPDFVW